jgi:hypothetical protein
MKYILSLIISGSLVVSGFGQTRNVLVGTNNAVVQPTNFWSADASNARSGLGLGTAATNPASAFQPSSSNLSNVAANNGVGLTNLNATNLVGTLSVSNGGTGSTNASDARLSLGLGTASTNPATAFQPADSDLNALASNNGGSLTNLQSTSIVGIIPASNIATVNFSNVGGTLAISSGGTGATNAGGARTNLSLGWSALTNSNSATSLLGFTTNGQVVASTGTNALAFTSPIAFYEAGTIDNLTIKQGRVISYVNDTSFINFEDMTFYPRVSVYNGTNELVFSAVAATTRTNLGLGAAWLTNTNVTNFRTDVGLGQTNSVTFSEVTVTNTFYPPTFSPTNLLTAAGSLRMTGSGTATRLIYRLLGATPLDRTVLNAEDNLSNLSNAATARTNLGLGASWLTNTNVTNFRTDIGLGATNNVTFNAVSIDGGSLSSYFDFGNSVQVLATTNNQDGLTIFFTGSERAYIGYDGVILHQSGGALAFGAGNTSGAAITRTNLGLGWPALTNTNAAGFNTSLYGSGTNPVLYNTNGDVVSPTNFWQQAPIATTVAFSAPATNSTNTATNSRNLIIQSLSSNIVNTTNTLLLPTNTSTFNGDTAVVIHAGGTGSATAIRQAGQTSNLIVLTNFDHAIRFLYFNNTWDFYHNLAYVEPIYFSGTNAAVLAAASRTNLGGTTVGNSVFTATNAGEAATAIGVGASNTPLFLGAYLSDSLIINGTNAQLIAGTNVSVRLDGASGLQFLGTSASTLSAITRTNLGLGLTALTNTNNANFQAAVFSTNTAPTNSANVNTVNFNTAVAWMEVTVSTNGTNHSFRIPLFK